MIEPPEDREAALTELVRDAETHDLYTQTAEPVETRPEPQELIEDAPVIETSADYRLAIELCQLVVEAAVDPRQGASAVGAALERLRKLLEGAPQTGQPDGVPVCPSCSEAGWVCGVCDFVLSVHSGPASVVFEKLRAEYRALVRTLGEELDLEAGAADALRQAGLSPPPHPE